jgi:hypothetical protein
MCTACHVPCLSFVLPVMCLACHVSGLSIVLPVICPARLTSCFSCVLSAICPDLLCPVCHVHCLSFVLSVVSCWSCVLSILCPAIISQVCHVSCLSRAPPGVYAVYEVFFLPCVLPAKCLACHVPSLPHFRTNAPF